MGAAFISGCNTCGIRDVFVYAFDEAISSPSGSGADSSLFIDVREFGYALSCSDISRNYRSRVSGMAPAAKVVKNTCMLA